MATSKRKTAKKTTRKITLKRRNPQYEDISDQIEYLELLLKELKGNLNNLSEKESQSISKNLSDIKFILYSTPRTHSPYNAY